MKELGGRFLLDQGTSKPKDRVLLRSRAYEFAHLSDVAPELSRARTPDWVAILVARHRGFTGFVSRDASMLEDPEPLVALDSSKLVFITWAKGLDDPIREWGQLMAFMPAVMRLAQGREPCVITLPTPQLRKESRVKPRSLLHDVATRRFNSSARETKATAVGAMKHYLDEIGRPELMP